MGRSVTDGAYRVCIFAEKPLWATGSFIEMKWIKSWGKTLQEGTFVCLTTKPGLVEQIYTGLYEFIVDRVDPTRWMI